ncbi:MAG TPA: Na+/H+ antiporter NhaA [Puia sp.]|nr:Na+/H+ antiporter NhaA [Puia sp.]
MFKEFFHSEKASGLILVGCVLVSMIVANSGWSESYIHFWELPATLHIGNVKIPFSIGEWINEGLMTVFFLRAGLEIERELYAGELAEPGKAILPIFSAIGGMLVPAGIYFLMNRGTPEQSGFGIPMATDIAFSLGVLALLGKRVPLSLKIFLTALAIIDDLGSVIVIAIFYNQSLSGPFLLTALLLFALLLLLNRLGVFHLWVYIAGGIVLWFCMYRSGAHPTLSGVMLAFAIPFRKKANGHASARLEHFLHRPVAFIIVPLFALANTAIPLISGWQKELFSHSSLGIELGLLVGKPLGIFGFSMLAIGLGWSTMPKNANKKQLAGIGLLGGIGFTISIFVSNLAFPNDPEKIQSAKTAVLFASLLAGISGWYFLRFQRRA